MSTKRATKWLEIQVSESDVYCETFEGIMFMALALEFPKCGYKKWPIFTLPEYTETFKDRAIWKCIMLFLGEQKWRIND